VVGFCGHGNVPSGPLNGSVHLPPADRLEASREGLFSMTLVRGWYRIWYLMTRWLQLMNPMEAVMDFQGNKHKAFPGGTEKNHEKLP
jgi:hypothetical protein